MIRPPPRYTPLYSPAASDVFINDEIAQRQALETAATERLLQLAASGFAAGRIAAAADALGEALERNPGLNTPALRRLIGRKLAKAMAASQEPTRKRGARSRKA
ncbi:MAG: hypothetical protein K1V74_02640, partial [Muribaculaceae bacterium]